MHDFLPINWLAVLTASGHIAMTGLLVMWIAIEIAEITRTRSLKTKHAIALAALFCILAYVLLRTFFLATGTITTYRIYAMRSTLALGAGFGWIYTVLYLLQRSGVKQPAEAEGMQIMTGRPEPVLNIAILVAAIGALLAFLDSLGISVSAELHDVTLRFFAVAGPILVALSRRWTTPMSSPQANDGTPLVRLDAVIQEIDSGAEECEPEPEHEYPAPANADPQPRSLDVRPLPKG